jgi:MFS family permease
MAIEFPNNTAMYLGYIMMSLTFGMAMGPVISSLVYPSLGYTYTFFFFGALLIVFGMIPIFFVPDRVNYGKYDRLREQQKKESMENDPEKSLDIS